MTDSMDNKLSGWVDQSLLSTIIEREARDFKDVLAHEHRVAGVAVDLATGLGMAPDAIAMLQLGARLHDVGKMLVPRQILDKPGALTPDERSVMETHAQKGAQMLASVPGVPHQVVDIAHYHHERYDGLGYHRLAGEQIPFMARIVAIADVYDALSSKRSYKASMSEGDVLVLMSQDAESGKSLGRRAFDPLLLRTFVSSRLGAVIDGITPEQRTTLAAFVASDPMLDLSDDLSMRVRLESDGSRVILDSSGDDLERLDSAGRSIEHSIPARAIA